LKTTEAIEKHIAQVRACRRCPDVCGPPVFGPAPGSRVLLVGQAPGPRERDLGRPFAYTAGRTLFSWFKRLGWSEEQTRRRIWFSAVIRCFPGRSPRGGDRVPSPEQIENCSDYLTSEIRLLRPRLVIAVGRLAIERLAGKMPLASAVGRTLRRTIGGVPVRILPLPHPSGRSTWVNDPANRRRLERALKLMGKHLGGR
jgi:uracil-DNA glycosylase